MMMRIACSVVGGVGIVLGALALVYAIAFWPGGMFALFDPPGTAVLGAASAIGGVSLLVYSRRRLAG